MTSFDGTTYTIIGTDFLEGLDVLPEQMMDYNLPAAEVYNDSVWVGNVDFTNGASLFMYDPEDTDEDSELWEEAYQLDADDKIINKMHLGEDIGGSDFLVFYTSNATAGTHIFGIGPSNNVFPLVDSGLGGVDPENNTEVVSITKRTVTDGKVDKELMLFSTQNLTDQTKIFGLVLGTDLSFDVTKDSLVGVQNRSVTRKSAAAKKSKQLTLRKNKKLKVKIKKKDVNKGDRFILYINDKKTKTKTSKKKKAVLLTKKLKKYKVGNKITVQVGVRRAYGQGKDRQYSTNVIMGTAKKIKMLKKKK